MLKCVFCLHINTFEFAERTTLNYEQPAVYLWNIQKVFHYANIAYKYLSLLVQQTGETDPNTKQERKIFFFWWPFLFVGLWYICTVGCGFVCKLQHVIHILCPAKHWWLTEQDAINISSCKTLFIPSIFIVLRSKHKDTWGHTGELCTFPTLHVEYIA